jgi:hypothetical protein
MFVLSAPVIALLVVCPILAVFVGAWLFRKDTEAENRKRAAIRVSSMLTAMGLNRLPRILEAYAVSDWSGLAYEVKSFAELSLDEKAVAAEFDAVFKNVLIKKIATEEGRAYVQAMLVEAKPV